MPPVYQVNTVVTNGEFYNEATVRTKLAASAGAVAVNSQKVTNLAAGTVATDAVNLGQLTAAAATTVTPVKTALYTAVIGEIVRVNPTIAGFIVNLPAISAANVGQSIKIKNVSSSLNVVTIDGDAAQTIDGQVTYSMTQAFEALTFVSDGVSNWMVV